MPNSNSNAVRIGVLGAGGRMGREIIATVREETAARLSGAVEHADHPCVGRALDEGLTIGSNALALGHASDVLVDFTAPSGLGLHLEAALSAGRAIVVGTTGLTPAQHAAIDEAARHIPVLQAANTSLGVNLLAELVRLAAQRLPDWDIEIVELHHRAKVDAPSGTALMLAEAALAGRGGQGTEVRGRAAHGGARQPGEIGMASLRGGSAAGDHQLLLLADGERLELGHRAENRSIFARGAVRAALWLARRPPGRYSMRDVLGLG